MSTALLTVKDVQRLYEELELKSKKFQEINAEILVINPQILLIFRLILNMSQPEFGKLMGIDDTNFSKYETGKIKNMQYKTAEKYVQVISKLIKLIPLERVIKNFERFKKESKGWFAVCSNTKKVLEARRKGAENSLKNRLTPQEEKVEELLKEFGINYKSNYLINKDKAIIVDFFIPRKKPIILECKRLTSSNRREVREQTKNLAFQGYKTKFYHNFILIALIESKKRLQIRDFQELDGPFEKVFTNLKQLRLFLTDVSL